MPTPKQKWYESWFNEDYERLYSYHDRKEAERQAQFIISRLDLSPGESLLDLGCGNGRHAIAFAKQGLAVTGVDLSTYLIEKGRLQAKEEKVTIRFLEQDIFDLQLEPFDCVVNLFTTFGYHETDVENQQLFFIVKKHLVEGGKFFLDYLHPARVRRNLRPVEEKNLEGEPVRIERRIEGKCVVKSIRFPGRTYEERVHLYERSEIESMLADAGLQVVEVWNGYDGRSWKEDGDRQLFYCRA